MELRQIAPADRDPALVAALLAVWEASVRATHHFLSEAAIRQIAGYVPQALGEVPLLAVAYDAQGHAVGFMVAAGGHLEMLFLDPAVRGRGLGRQLLRHGIHQWGVRSLDPRPGASTSTWAFASAGARRRTDRDGPIPSSP